MFSSPFALRTAPATLLVFLLASCSATQPPIRVVEYTSTTETNEQLEDRIGRLEEAESRLHAQYDAMGQTLIWLRGEIKSLRTQHTVQYKPIPAEEQNTRHTLNHADMEIAPPSSTMTPATSTAKPESKEEKAEAASPAPTTGIAPLSASDLAIEPAAGTPATTATNPPPAVTMPETVYLVHLTSFKGTDHIDEGWREVTRKTPQALAGLSPVQTSFHDKNGNEWIRLSVGPFPSAQDATGKCNNVKKEGGWCDIIKTPSQPLSTAQ